MGQVANTSGQEMVYVNSDAALQKLGRLVRSGKRAEPLVLFVARSEQQGATMSKLVRPRVGNAKVVVVSSGVQKEVPKILGTALGNDEFLIVRKVDTSRGKLSASRVHDLGLGARLEKLNNKLFEEGLALEVERTASREDRMAQLRQSVAERAVKPPSPDAELGTVGRPVPVPRPSGQGTGHVRSEPPAPSAPGPRRGAPPREELRPVQAPRRALQSSAASYRTFLRVQGSVIAPVRHHLGSWLEEKGIELSLLGPESGQDTDGDESRSWQFDVGQVGLEKALRFTLHQTTESRTFTTEIAAYESNDSGWLFIHVHNDAGLPTGTPRLSKVLVPALQAFDGNSRVAGSPKNMTAEQALGVLQDPTRQLPLLVFGTDENLPSDMVQGLAEKAKAWTSSLAGQAHIALLEPQETTAFNSRVEQRIRCWPWSIGIYRPGIDSDDPMAHKQHRFISTRVLAESPDSHLSRRLVGITRGSALVSAPQSELRHVDSLLSKVARQRAQQAELDAIQRRVEASQTAPKSSPSIALETPVTPQPDPLLEELRLTVLELFDAESLSEELLELVQDTLTRPDDSTRAAELDQQLADMELRFTLELDEAEASIAAAEASILELQDEADSSRRESQYYQRELAKTDPQAAYGFSDAEEKPYELGIDGVITATQGLAHVETTWDADVVRDVEEWDTYQTVPRLAWDALTALDAYARDKSKGYSGSFLDYIKDGRSTLSPGRVALGESKATMARWGAERLFPVPEAVSPDGRIHMEAHIRISRVGGDKSPRMHFYDDTAGTTGKIYVGYLGRHLTNTQTANR